MANAQFFQIAAPAAGLNQEDPPTMIGGDETPRVQNVRFRGGEVFKRRGYTTLMSASMASTPVLLNDFDRLAGSTTAMMATLSNLYKWTGATFTSVKSGLSGTVGGRHSACTMNDTWIYTNGVDHVQVWTGTGNASDLAGGDDYQTPTYHLCRAVVTFADRLLLLGTNEDGTSYPYRIRWSELGKTDEYDTSAGGGYFDLEGDPTGAQCGVPIGAWLAVYCGNRIYIGQYVGGLAVFRFDVAVPNKGTLAPRTVIDLGFDHIFMGQDDVYLFNGTALTGVGGRIRDDLFKNVSRTNFPKCFAMLNEDEHLYYLYVPYGESGGKINRQYVYDYQQDRWTIDTIENLTAASALELGSRGTIDELPSDKTIDEMDHEPIDALGGFEGRNFRCFANSGGYIFKDDLVSLDDNGTAIDARWESKDLVLDDRYVNHYKRIIEIMFEAKGASVDVAYSTDLGATWTEAGDQTLVSDYARYSFYVDTVGRQLRLRFKNDNSGERFWLRWLGVRYTVGSDR